MLKCDLHSLLSLESERFFGFLFPLEKFKMLNFYLPLATIFWKPGYPLSIFPLASPWSGGEQSEGIIDFSFSFHPCFCKYLQIASWSFLILNVRRYEFLVSYDCILTKILPASFYFIKLLFFIEANFLVYFLEARSYIIYNYKLIV